MSAVTDEERAACMARQTYGRTLDIFGGTDGGVGFVRLKSNLDYLYFQYQNEPTEELAVALAKVQEAFRVVESLAK